MRILYSLPHPSHVLDGPGAGHVVRARSLLGALEARGHEVERVQAARAADSQRLVGGYHSLRRLLPRPVAMAARDLGRVRFGRRRAVVLGVVADRVRPDVVIETQVAFSECAARACPPRHLPLVLDDVAPPWEEAIEGRVGLQVLASRVWRRQVAAARLVVAVNPIMAGLLRDAGAPADRIVVIRNAAPVHRPTEPPATVREHLGLPSDGVVVAFVGSFQAYQRLDLLLAALAGAGLPDDVRLLMIGGRPDQVAAFGDDARRAGVAGRVVCTGFAAEYDVPRLLSAADIGVLPATNDYGNPMKLYDYVAAGLAVVAPDQPTVTDVVEDGRDALLFDPGRPDALGTALARLAVDDALCQRLRAGARRAAGDNTWDERAATLEESLAAAGIGAGR